MRSEMKNNVILIISSLLSILLTMIHHADDITRGMASGGVANLVVVLILVVWLYGTLMLTKRQAGYIIILFGSLFASGLPIIHMTGAGLAGGRIAYSADTFFFVWTLIALGVTAVFSAALSICNLWMFWRRPGSTIA